MVTGSFVWPDLSSQHIKKCNNIFSTSIQYFLTALMTKVIDFFILSINFENLQEFILIGPQMNTNSSKLSKLILQKSHKVMNAMLPKICCIPNIRD